MSPLEPGPKPVASREFAVTSKRSVSSLRKLIDDDGIQLYRVQQDPGSLEIGSVLSHVLSMHAIPVNVRARFGDDRFDGTARHGDLSFCPEGARMSIAWDRAIDVTALWLSPSFVARVLEVPLFDVTPFFYRPNPVLSQIFALLTRNAAAGEPYGRLFRDGLVTSLAAGIGGWRRQAFDDAVAHCGLPPTRLRRVLDFVESHLVEDIPLSSLAAQARVSERHFCTMFRRTMGRPPHRYVIERRLEQAKLLLRANRSMTITEVAMSVGFRSSAHFATMFGKFVGVTPTDFRRDG